MPCHYCKKIPIFRCHVCGKKLCTEHTTFASLCPSCRRRRGRKEIYRITSSTVRIRKDKIKEFVRDFWGEENQETFGMNFEVAMLPMYIAESGKKMIGFASYANCKDALLIVTFGVAPQYQGAGIGKALMDKIETQARKEGRRRIVLSTSNDDLPALAFYQSMGFQIYEVKPNVIAEKHGRVIKGIGGLPVRDELRLQKIL